MRRWSVIVLMLVVGVGLSVMTGLAQDFDTLHPNPLSSEFISYGSSSLDGQALQEDNVVRAYDSTGVLSGEKSAIGGDYPGWYLVPVYGDDPMTTATDEGAQSGELIYFTVDGHQAVVGPNSEEPVWEDEVLLREVNLEACTLAGDFDCDCRVTAVDLMRQAEFAGGIRGETGYYLPYDHDVDYDIDAGDLATTASEWRSACQP